MQFQKKLDYRLTEESGAIMEEHIKSYTDSLSEALRLDAMQQVPLLGKALRDAWQAGRCVSEPPS
jgi:hypothetical protein